MGVDGFWPIVSSKGKRVTLDILSDKVIAIDASIWIYQFANALRDAGGDPVRSSHIVGFFKRICKLLYLRIRPVFVFDGPPIPLKFAALKKRHEDIVPDSMFRKAARQILLQNLKQLQADPSSITRGSQPVLQPRESEDDDSVDEIYVVTDSSDGEYSPSRRLRLSVPEAFRGFMSERRTLDSVSLPVNSSSSWSRAEEPKDVEVDARIDEEALKDLPLHEQYRGLLETRSALLSQGRRRALNLASKMGVASDFADLEQLSKDQIKAVVDLAKVTDMSKAIRMQMSREENKEEVYIPATSSGATNSTSPRPNSTQDNGGNKRRKKAKTDQFYLESSFSDKHSVLSSARLASREDLLFGNLKNDSPKKEDAEKSADDKLKSEDSSEDEKPVDVGSLFGTEWSDLVKTSQPVKPIEEKPAMSPWSPAPPPEIVPAIKKVDIPLPEPELPVAEPSQAEVSETSSESIESEMEVESESEASIELATDSETEARIPVSIPPKTVPQTAQQDIVKPAAPAHPKIIPASDISDDQLLMFAELADPFPAFENYAEEELFDNRVRERINVVESLESTYEEIQRLLTAFGVPWVSAPADAEAQCAFLAAAGLTDGVISDDSDTIIYGSPIVFRHLYVGESTVEIYRTSEIGFDREELISLAMLLGCDFTVGVRGIGPVNATEIVRHYKGIDGLKRFREWAERFATDSGKVTEVVTGENPEDEMLKFFKATHANYRSQWLFPDDFPSQEVWDVFDQPLVDTNLEPFSWAVPDEDLIAEVVTELSDLKHDQVLHILSSTMEQYRQSSAQRRITDYFSPAFERGRVAEVVSKRLKAALARQTPAIHSSHS